MMKDLHTDPSSHDSPQRKHPKQGLFWYSMCLIMRTPLVDADQHQCRTIDNAKIDPHDGLHCYENNQVWRCCNWKLVRFV